MWNLGRESGRQVTPPFFRSKCPLSTPKFGADRESFMSKKTTDKSLRDEFLKRIKNPKQFQGLRYIMFHPICLCL